MIPVFLILRKDDTTRRHAMGVKSSLEELTTFVFVRCVIFCFYSTGFLEYIYNILDFAAGISVSAISILPIAYD